MNNNTEKHDSSAGQNEPRKADKIHQSPESVHHALERKMSGLDLAPAKSGQMSDLGQGSKFTASDQVLATTAQKSILKQTKLTSGTDNVEQTVQRKPKKGRTKRGDKVQKPASSEPASSDPGPASPEAGPSRTPTGPGKGDKSQKPASSDAQGCEFTPQAGPSRTPASDVFQATKTSVDTQFTAALLAITARKGTKKRKAQVKQLTEALAARDACDDIYGATGAPVDIVGDILDEDPWAQMSDLRASSMGTPTPNSPHMSPSKSCSSFSSDHSTPMSVPPPFANAILQGIRGKKAPAQPPTSTPKLAHNRKKHLSVSAWAKELKVLGEAMDRDQIRANCAESSNEEGSDTESSSSAKLPPLLL